MTLPKLPSDFRVGTIVDLGDRLGEIVRVDGARPDGLRVRDMTRGDVYLDLRPSQLEKVGTHCECGARYRIDDDFVGYVCAR